LLVKEMYFLRTKFDNKTNIQSIFVIVLSILGLKEEKDGYKKKVTKKMTEEREHLVGHISAKKKPFLMSMTSFSQDKFNGDDIFL